MTANPNSSPDPRLIVALDFAERDTCLALVDQLDARCCRLKIGKEMFTRFGPPLVQALQSRGFEVFLDLKFHDIPSTVAKAVTAAARLGVWMVNVHAAGGRRMMEAARKALLEVENPPLLLAVTVLTSMDDADLRAVGVETPAPAQALNLAQLAAACKLDGVVCSAQEAAAIKQRCGDSFLCVTPGIRPTGSESGDQRRIMTPQQALQNGSDYLVIGRPITQAQSPLRSLQNIAAAIEELYSGLK